MQKYIFTLLLLSNLSVAMTEQQANAHWHDLIPAWTSTKILQELLAAGANANMLDGGCLTVLQSAVYSEKTEVVKILVTAGVDVDKGTRGFAPLMMAACNTNPAIAPILIAAGADRTIEDHLGRTAADLALGVHSVGLHTLLTQPVKLP